MHSFKFALIYLIGPMIILVNVGNVSAQVTQMDPQIVDQVMEKFESKNKNNLIREFRESRSGERGVFGFINWIFSKEKWGDIWRFLQQLISQTTVPLEIDVDVQNAKILNSQSYEEDTRNQFAAHGSQHACDSSQAIFRRPF